MNELTSAIHFVVNNVFELTSQLMCVITDIPSLINVFVVWFCEWAAAHYCHKIMNGSTAAFFFWCRPIQICYYLAQWHRGTSEVSCLQPPLPFYRLLNWPQPEQISVPDWDVLKKSLMMSSIPLCLWLAGSHFIHWLFFLASLGNKYTSCSPSPCKHTQHCLTKMISGSVLSEINRKN